MFRFWRWQAPTARRILRSVIRCALQKRTWAPLLEAKVEDALAEGVTALGGIAFKFKPFGVIGVPDRIVLLPGGVLIFVELKRPIGGVVKPWQSRMHEKLRNLGFRVEVLSTIQLVHRFLRTL
jgi:hypothetical protein